jgi:hypothetical protein
MSSFGNVATIDLYAPSMRRLIKCSGLQPPIGASPGELRLWLKMNGLFEDRPSGGGNAYQNRARSQVGMRPTRKRGSRPKLPPINASKMHDVAPSVRERQPLRSVTSNGNHGDQRAEKAAEEERRLLQREAKKRAAAKEAAEAEYARLEAEARQKEDAAIAEAEAEAMAMAAALARAHSLKAIEESNGTSGSGDAADAEPSGSVSMGVVDVEKKMMSSTGMLPQVECLEDEGAAGGEIETVEEAAAESMPRVVVEPPVVEVTTPAEMAAETVAQAEVAHEASVEKSNDHGTADNGYDDDDFEID